eukprot:3308855-Pyramimonas_sp.AAC.1
MPRVYHATGDMATGRKMVLMEDLASCAQAGHFFGAGNPNNWGRDLDALQKGFLRQQIEGAWYTLLVPPLASTSVV